MADPTRKLAAKRANERVKLTAAALNGTAIATLVAAFLVPAMNGTASVHLGWIPVAIVLHLAGHARSGC